ncbi:alpha/beta hydrolase fold protein [Janthinobacterium sp. HH01]|uniref:alpha/beta fold hydrolase n=1 Tax=Janthinobacterium sp. HH01 TaxID=1198452 RepID=UPI0002AEC0F3|nr:alpha/beta hydrolase [Janthinobacterium sp. HH01]ELX09538.1 alpha/beta hydrolase fold protein [Janthinobacterium sp. HH01]
MAKALFGCALLALAAGAVSPVLAASAASSDAGRAFAKPQQLIDVGGRKMNLHCSGAGATTVLFDSPSGDAGWAWFKVQPQVAQHTRACVFDRAGFGFSDAANRPNTSENVVEDLHKLLAGAGIKPPYILVGNSLGGANVQVYAYRYPDEVKGLVLVEAQHEDETARLDKVTDGKIKQIYSMVEQQNQYCLAAASKGKGIAARSEQQKNCIGDPATFFGQSLGTAVLANERKPLYWRTMVAERNAFKDSDDQLRALRRPFGDLPLVVLTRGISPYAVPNQPQSALNKAMEDENVAIQKQMAALSTHGTQRIVAGAGHGIQADKPEAVIEAVLEVLKQVR